MCIFEVQRALHVIINLFSGEAMSDASFRVDENYRHPESQDTTPDEKWTYWSSSHNKVVARHRYAGVDDIRVQTMSMAGHWADRPLRLPNLQEHFCGPYTLEEAQPYIDDWLEEHPEG
jgi:hypothetical protein